MAYKKEAKPDYSLLCKEMLDPVARVFTKGVPKHGRRNYLTNPDVTDEELIAAAGRHWAADASNPGAIDDGEGGMGEQHITCMIANGLMLLHRRATRSATPAKHTAPQAPFRPGDKVWCHNALCANEGVKFRGIYTVQSIDNDGYVYLDEIKTPAGDLSANSVARFTLVED